jgi:hypothetical protein
MRRQPKLMASWGLRITGMAVPIMTHEVTEGFAGWALYLRFALLVA